MKKLIQITVLLVMLAIQGCGTMKGLCQDGAWFLNEMGENINAGEESAK